jgi:DNA-binding NarL/FixJ family response regulator
MVYREVTRVEIKEVLRQWVGGAGCKRIGTRLGMDVKTVRRYVRAAQALGLTRASGETALGDEWLTALLASLRTQAGRPRGDAWERCQAHHDRIKQLLA